jgi:hypothetical protein
VGTRHLEGGGEKGYHVTSHGWGTQFCGGFSFKECVTMGLFHNSNKYLNLCFAFETQMLVSVRQMCFVRKDPLLPPFAFIRKVSNKIRHNE